MRLPCRHLSLVSRPLYLPPMGTEIERKYLIKDESWRVEAGEGVRFRQGYLVGSEKASVRVRVEGTRGNINIKSVTLGIRRMEYEYDIPLADAEELLDQLCEKPLVEKTRYFVTHGAHVWEIDEFVGDNEGLVVAEVELRNEDEVFELPPWAGEEVSHDRRYYNVSLVTRPYKTW